MNTRPSRSEGSLQSPASSLKFTLRSGSAWPRALLVTTGMWVAGALTAAATVGEGWEWRNPLPQGSGLKATAESGGRLIAVGRAGAVLTTEDGMTWTPRTSGTTAYLRAVAADGATVVAAGSDGVIVVSTDGGVSWSVKFSGQPVPSEWRTVVRAGGVWVVAGASGASPAEAVMISADGMSWAPASVPNSVGTIFNCAVWTGTRVILGGANYFAPGRTILATSEDGTTWSQRTADLFEIDGLAWTGSRVVAVGTALTSVGGAISNSPDGLTWTDALSPKPVAPFVGVVWTGDRLVAWLQFAEAATPGIFTSPTGETWTPRVLSQSMHLRPVAAAASGNTIVLGGDDGRVERSTDGGATWNPVISGVPGHCNALVRFAGRWVAVGSDGMMTSSADGESWVPASSGTNARLRAIAWHDGLWVAGGRSETASGSLIGPVYSLFTSTDGVSWSDRSFGEPPTDPRQIYNVSRVGTQWIATALFAVLTSADGLTWEPHPVGVENRAVAWNGTRLVVVGGIEDDDDSEGRVHVSDTGGAAWTDERVGFSFLRGVAWTGSQFVAVGDDGTALTSPTGDPGSWTSRSTGSSLDLRGVIADGENLIAVGGNFSAGPIILTSPDGIGWTPRSAPTTQLLYSVTKAGSEFVATGYDGVVLTSPDGVAWTLRPTGTTHELYAGAWGDGQLLVSGEAGAILANVETASQPVDVPWDDITRLPGPATVVRLAWSATPEDVYEIESTTTLTQPWVPIPGSPRTATGTGETIDFTESAPVTQRFFRVRQR